MLQFLSDNWGTLLAAAIVVAAVVLVIVKMTGDRRKGRNACACGCAGCPSAGACRGCRHEKPTA